MRSVKQIQFMRQKPSGYHKAVMIGLMDTRSSRRGSGRRSGMFGMVGDTLLSGGYMDGNKPLLCALLNTGPRLTLHESVVFLLFFFFLQLHVTVALLSWVWRWLYIGGLVFFCQPPECDPYCPI